MRCREGVLMEDFWNETKRPLEGSPFLLERIEAARQGIGERTALSFEGHKLSHEALHTSADALVRHLQSLGVRPNMLIGVCAERGIEMVVALLAVLKSGAAYVPLDPAMPRERLGFMLRDTQAPVLLVQNHLLPMWTGLLDSVQVIDLNETQRAQDTSGRVAPMPCPKPEAEDAIYCIYTSGSTGQPKGAVNVHQAVTNRIVWMQDAYGLSHDDVVLQKTPYSFDVSVWEFFWPLMAGARMVIAKPEGHKDPFYLRDLIQREGVTTVHFVPSMLQAFLDTLTEPWMSPLKRVFCSGEALPRPVVKQFFHSIPGVELHNLYGPTEAAIDVTYYDCAQIDDHVCVPIGRPISNVQMHVLNEQLQPVALGELGELFIGGAGLARGYLHRPELTAEKFIPSPLPHWPGRLYRTGDLGRVLPDGNIEYLGRMDHQVKVRGLRIELGEIESRILTLPGVSQAAVVARTLGHGDADLVAFWSMRPDASPLTEAQLQTHLGISLPGYMVPRVWIEQQGLPLSSNGKIDRKALSRLAEPTKSKPIETTPQPTWHTDTERHLAQLWGDVLHAKPGARTEDFLQLGGTSLSAIRLVGLIARHMGRQVKAAHLLVHSSLADQSRLIDAAPTLSQVQPPASQGYAQPVPLTRGQSDLLTASALDPSQRAYWLHWCLRLPHTMDLAQWTGHLADCLQGLGLLGMHVTHDEGRWLAYRQTSAAPNWWTAHEAIAQDPSQGRWDASWLQQVCQPLDLSKDGVLRGQVWPLTSGQHLMILSIHHAFADEACLEILLERMQSSFEPADRGPSAKAQIDLSLLEQQWTDAGEVRRVAALLALSSPEAPVAPTSLATGTELPLDWTPQMSVDLQAVAHERHCSPFPVLLTAWGCALAELFQEDAIWVATPFSRRVTPELADTFNYWLDVRILQASAGRQEDLNHALSRLINDVAQAQKPSFVPLSEISKRLRMQGHSDLARGLMRHGLTWRHDSSRMLKMGRHRVELIRVPETSPKFGLCLHVQQNGTMLKAALEGASALLTQTRVNALWDAFGRALAKLHEQTSMRPVSLPSSDCDTPHLPMETLTQAWSSWTGQPAASVRPDSSFFAQGGTSLKAIRMAAQMRDALGTPLDLTRFFRTPTFQGLCQSLTPPEQWPEKCVGLGPVDAPHLLVLIPGAGGRAEGLIRLAKSLQDLLPGGHAIVIPDLDAIVAAHLQVSDQAHDLDGIKTVLADHLRALNPDRIKALVGFSIGGLLAMSLHESLALPPSVPVLMLDTCTPRALRNSGCRRAEARISGWINRNIWRRPLQLVGAAPDYETAGDAFQASPSQWNVVTQMLAKTQLRTQHLRVHLVHATLTTDYLGLLWRSNTRGFRPKDFAQWGQTSLALSHLDMTGNAVNEVALAIMRPLTQLAS
jgi:amino acid adenylation domain-containing protein